jgi:thioredoxin reductase
VRLADGSLVQLDVFALEPRFSARADLLAELGVKADDHPMGEILACSSPAESVVPGVWLAGNVADLGAQVIGAAADGARAAIGINSELLQEDVQAAVDEHRRRN